MADWHIDLGFDWDATKQNSDGTSYLQYGIVSVPSGTTGLGPVGTWTDIRAGDTIEFYVYDVSALSDGTPSPTGTVPTIVGTWLQCAAADENTASAPWAFTEGPTAANQGVSLSAATAGPSSIFGSGPTGGGFPVWTIQDSTNSLLSLTVTGPTATPQSYLLTLQLVVNSPSAPSGPTTKTFEVDPEMIVQSGG
jgi:hypothetical protein